MEDNETKEWILRKISDLRTSAGSLVSDHPIAVIGMVAGVYYLGYCQGRSSSIVNLFKECVK